MLSNIERNSDPNSPGEAELANEINQAFLRLMTNFTPLLPNYWQTNTDGRSEAFCVSEFFVFKKLIALNPNKTPTQALTPPAEKIGKSLMYV